MNAHGNAAGRRSFPRLLLVAVFLIQRLGDAAIFYATYIPNGPQPKLRGVVIASLIWMSALLVGVWRRLRWSRYLATTFGWLYVFAISFLTLMDWEQSYFEQGDPRVLPLASAVLYLAANVILVRSRRLRHYANL